MRSFRKLMAIVVSAFMALACAVVVLVVYPCDWIGRKGLRLIDWFDLFSKHLGEWAYYGRWPRE